MDRTEKKTFFFCNGDLFKKAQEYKNGKLIYRKLIWDDQIKIFSLI
jgi:hypothetical protein